VFADAGRKVMRDSIDHQESARGSASRVKSEQRDDSVYV
jgi:hypothetical protein